MMKNVLKLAIPIALILSFLLILLISPDQDAYLSRFDENQYVTVAALDVPEGIQSTFSNISNLPIKLGYEQKDIDQVRILINKSLDRNANYMRDNLDVKLVTDPENGYANLEITIPGYLFYFRGESFNIVNIFENYKNLFDERRHPLILIQIPEYYQLPLSVERLAVR